MLKNKKGFSHIEVILSFIIFTGFTIFLIAIFNPLKITSSQTTNLNILDRAIRDYAETDVSFLTLNVKNPESFSTCFNINLQEDPVNNVVVKNSDGVIIDSNKLERKISIEKSGKFYYLYYCEEFIESGNLNSCTDLSIEDYNLGVNRNFKMFSYKKLQELNQKYNSEYENLKKELGISSEFYFFVRDSAGNKIFEPLTRRTSGQVSALDIPIEIINETGDMKISILNIRTWT